MPEMEIDFIRQCIIMINTMYVITHVYIPVSVLSDVISSDSGFKKICYTSTRRIGL